MLEIGEKDIKYKKASHLDGPTYLVSVANVVYIRFEDGSTDIFSQEDYDRYTWRPIHRIDVEKLRAAAPVLTGTHDYSSFVVERSMIEEAVRTIYRIDVQEFDRFCCVTFVGNGFLYKMIRCLMGTLEAAGAGKLTPGDVRRILNACDRAAAPETAPPQGLFLMKVFYSPEERDSFRLESLPFC